MLKIVSVTHPLSKFFPFVSPADARPRETPLQPPPLLDFVALGSRASRRASGSALVPPVRRGSDAFRIRAAASRRFAPDAHPRAVAPSSLFSHPSSSPEKESPAAAPSPVRSPLLHMAEKLGRLYLKVVFCDLSSARSTLLTTGKETGSLTPRNWMVLSRFGVRHLADLDDLEAGRAHAVAAGHLLVQGIHGLVHGDLAVLLVRVVDPVRDW